MVREATSRVNKIGPVMRDVFKSNIEYQEHVNACERNAKISFSYVDKIGPGSVPKGASCYVGPFARVEDKMSRLSFAKMRFLSTWLATLIANEVTKNNIRKLTGTDLDNQLAESIIVYGLMHADDSDLLPAVFSYSNWKMYQNPKRGKNIMQYAWVPVRSPVISLKKKEIIFNGQVIIEPVMTLDETPCITVV